MVALLRTKESSKNIYHPIHAVPNHVAIIMDGNRRWAKSNHLSVIKGHSKGASVLLEIVKEAIDLGIKTLTVYSLSTENWSRPKDEIDGLMQVFSLYLVKMRKKMVDNGVKLETIGDLQRFPDHIKQKLNDTISATASGKRLRLVLALNYGGRDELKRSVIKIVEDIESGKISKEDISENLLASYLDTKDIGDPDLLIRTSGENRISNFLIWQIAYSEVYISDVLWPDFTRENFKEAIRDYQSRERRLGG